MVGGIALIGVVTASIASWLIAQVRSAENDAQAALHREIQAYMSGWPGWKRC
jgi:voltage-gated potassium channel